MPARRIPKHSSALSSNPLCRTKSWRAATRRFRCWRTVRKSTIRPPRMCANTTYVRHRPPIRNSCGCCSMLTETRVALPENRDATVFRAGDDDAPPLVWFHSLYGVEFDAPLIDRLAEHHAVYAPLAPGFNELSELDELHDIHDLALHYDDVFAALELEAVPL